MLLFYAFLGSVIVPQTLSWLLTHKIPDLLNCDVYVRGVYFNPFQFRLTIQRLELISPSGIRTIGFEGLDVDFQLSSLWSDDWAFRHIILDRPYVNIVLSREGHLNLLSLLPPDKDSPSKTAERTSLDPRAGTEKDKKPPKALLISSFILTNGTVNFRDETPQTPFEFSVRPITTRLEYLTTRVDKASGLNLRLLNGSQGTLAVQGACSIEALACHTRLQMESIPLTILQPYISNILPLQLSGGTLSLNGEVSYRGGNLPRPDAGFQGDLHLAGLAIFDPEAGQNVFSWEDLGLQDINFSLPDQALRIKDVRLKGLSLAAVMDKDGQINFARFLSPAPSGPPQPKTEPLPPPSPKPEHPSSTTAQEPAFQFRVNRVQFTGGSISFTDHSVQPPFRTNLSSLDLTLTPLSGQSTQRTDFELKSQLDRTGILDIKGYAYPLNIAADKQLTLSLQNYEITGLSPYFGKYLGYAIDQGQLKIDISYDIKPDQMSGKHHLLLHKFTLGPRTASPDALRVPIKLALALLEDSHQQIDLGVPVKGNPAAPEFEFKHVILTAFKNIFTKIITAPFSVLAGLTGDEESSEPLDYIGFTAGQAALPGPQRNKALKIANALQSRPKLVLEIQAAYDPQNDKDALRRAAFEASYAAAKRESSKPDEFVLEQMYKKHIGWKSLTELRDTYRKLAREGQDKKENRAAFYQELQEQLVENYQVEKALLQDLGVRRAQALKSLLMQEGRLPEDRLLIKDNSSETGSEDHLVKIPLSLTSPGAEEQTIPDEGPDVRPSGDFPPKTPEQNPGP